MPDEPQTPKVDAVLISLECVAIRQFRTDSELCLYYNRKYGPVLGSKRVHARHVGASLERLLTADGSSAVGSGGHRYHPDNHPKAGEDRYAWVDQGDGVSYGTLVPEGS